MQGSGHGQRRKPPAGGLNHPLSPRASMSPPMEPGSVAPTFNLPNANAGVGQDSVSLADAMGKNGLIVAFTCNHCPYVIGSDEVTRKTAEKYAGDRVRFVGINSNSKATHPDDDFDHSGHDHGRVSA